MNMQAMMQQARKLQKELEKTTTEIDNTTFTYENANVLVEGLGSNRITKIEIKNEDILEDGEMLADVLTVAVNNVLDHPLSRTALRHASYPRQRSQRCYCRIFCFRSNVGKCVMGCPQSNP